MFHIIRKCCHFAPCINNIKYNFFSTISQHLYDQHDLFDYKIKKEKIIVKRNMNMYIIPIFTFGIDIYLGLIDIYPMDFINPIYSIFIPWISTFTYYNIKIFLLYKNKFPYI